MVNVILKFRLIQGQGTSTFRAEGFGDVVQLEDRSFDIVHREAIGDGGKILRSKILLRMIDDVLREIELSRGISRGSVYLGVVIA